MQQSRVESLYVEILTNCKRKNIVVGIIYRPPNQIVHDFIYNLMEIISKENKICYLMCDFNLNLLKHCSYQLMVEFLGCMFFPLITSHTATIIDNIFTNHSHNHTFNGFTALGLSFI